MRQKERRQSCPSLFRSQFERDIPNSGSEGNYLFRIVIFTLLTNFEFAFYGKNSLSESPAELQPDAHLFSTVVQMLRFATELGLKTLHSTLYIWLAGPHIRVGLVAVLGIPSQHASDDQFF